MTETGLGGRDIVAWNPVFLARGGVEIFLDKLFPPRQSLASAHKNNYGKSDERQKTRDGSEVSRLLGSGLL
jgi:hypothetical protein